MPPTAAAVRGTRSRLERLGRFEARHARVVVVVWVLVVAAAFALALGAVSGRSLFDRLTSGQPSVPGETRVAQDLLAAQGDQGEQVLLRVDGIDPAAPSTRALLSSLAARLAGQPDVTGVQAPSTIPGGPASLAAGALTSPTGVAMVVRLRPGLDQHTQAVAAQRLQQVSTDAVRPLPGARVTSGSTAQLVEAITSQVAADLSHGERIALPVSLLVMVLVFGGFVAAGLPLAGAVASIGGGLAALYGFSTVIDLDATVVNVVTILGLGLCIDYGLLTVSRFREELRSRPSPDGGADLTPDEVVDAVGRTVAVAGRTVLFSGLIVATSLAGLMFFDAQVLRALGAAGVSVVLVALLVALTFVPGQLALAARRLARPGLATRLPVGRRVGDVAPERGVFSALATAIQRHPWPVALGTTAVLVLVALPAAGMQLRASGRDLLPVTSPQRAFFDGLRADYPALGGPDVTVVTEAPPARLAAWSRQVAALPGVESVDPPTTQGRLALLGLRVQGGDSGGPVATEVVKALRRDEPDFPVYVTGQAAGQVDFSAALTARAPLAVGVVVLATFVLLFLMTGSVLVPLKALVMNVVSLGASLGAVTYVFQGGHLERVLDFTSDGGIDSTIPPLVLAFGFGLSMDYEVFLLSRIKEQRDLGLGNDAAVVAGLQRSGRIITSAALLVVIVFAGLLLAKVLVIQQTGLALTVAVAVDATLVRMLLVPATMTLLGEWNWWAPPALRRLHDRIGMGAH